MFSNENNFLLFLTRVSNKRKCSWKRSLKQTSQSINKELQQHLSVLKIKCVENIFTYALRKNIRISRFSSFLGTFVAALSASLSNM